MFAGKKHVGSWRCFEVKG